MVMNTRCFPPPWRADKIPGGYVVGDADVQARAATAVRKAGSFDRRFALHGDELSPRSNLPLQGATNKGRRHRLLEANMVWRLMWQVKMWFTPRPLNGPEHVRRPYAR
jgi:hypothetical protein